MQVIPTPESVLRSLASARLLSLGRIFDVALPARHQEKQIKSLLQAPHIHLDGLLQHLGRDELKAICRQHGLEEKGRARIELVQRILQASGQIKQVTDGQHYQGKIRLGAIPNVGDTVEVRRRQYLVESIDASSEDPSYATRISLLGIEDDNQGRRLDVFWDLELGAQVLTPASKGLDQCHGLESPDIFHAYIHALRWQGVTATDETLFQAPFHAGIQALPYQMLPLQKALALPKVNLFIADDVGLGKTIEAGLILQEMILRQRVDFVLICCPAAVCPQWRDEMEKRFGLNFEIYHRMFVANKRRERGFTVNPWSSFHRFVISHQLLRRPEYKDPLLQYLQENPTLKTLLILDEAHAAAPASQQLYAVDSQFTKTMRELTRCFEHRLFLSATPHNGHSNSFAALLEMLDPQRFTRGVPIHDKAQLAPVLVRRLKQDIKRVVVDSGFPQREIVHLALHHQGGDWAVHHPVDGSVLLGTATPYELTLYTMLEQYDALLRKESKQHRLVLIHLQKRLLSSIEAFYKSLRFHAQSVGLLADALHGEMFDSSDEQDEEEQNLHDMAILDSTAILSAPLALSIQARHLLESMLSLAEKARYEADGKILALYHFLRQAMCPGTGQSKASQAALQWHDRKIILFTEYMDTKRYVANLLDQAIAHTHRGDERILHFHGGMSDEQREHVQQAFNSPPQEHPVRILLATDAAREGLNLQAYCADLFHLDIPWNPARMEQRNGRIDRTLQPSPIVRCHYFTYPQRSADRILLTLVRKVQTIARELGSLSAIVLEQCADACAHGLTEATATQIESIVPTDRNQQRVQEELESTTLRENELREANDRAAELLNKGMKRLEIQPETLRQVVHTGLRRLFHQGLSKSKEKSTEDEDVYMLPDLPGSWAKTLDSLRPVKEKDQTWYQWRQTPPLPVVFANEKTLRQDRRQLHLAHPFVKRVLHSLTAQGIYQTINKVTVVRNPNDATARIVLLTRICLFGPGATRLHDEIIPLSAPWLQSKRGNHLKPDQEDIAQKFYDTAIRLLEKSKGNKKFSQDLEKHLLNSVQLDFSILWPHAQHQAAQHVALMAAKLKQRGKEEAQALREILQAQQQRIADALAAQDASMQDGSTDLAIQKQRQAERKHMEERLALTAKELVEDPGNLEALYHITLQRVEPVGMIYLWPEQ